MEHLNIDDDMLNFFSDYNININNLVTNDDNDNNNNNNNDNKSNTIKHRDTTVSNDTQFYNNDVLINDDLINDILNDNDHYTNNTNNSNNTNNTNNTNDNSFINEINEYDSNNNDDYYKIKKYELIDKNNYIDFKELDIKLQDELINELNINGEELKNDLLLINYKLFHMANLLKIKEECCKRNILENKNNHKTKNNHTENDDDNEDNEENDDEVELSANDIELILEIENNLNYELFENIVSYCHDNTIIIKNENNIHKKVKHFRLIEDNDSLKMNGFIKYIVITKNKNKNKNEDYILDIKTGCFIKYSDDNQKILITLDYKHFFYISKYRIIFKKIKIEDIIYLTDKYS